MEYCYRIWQDWTKYRGIIIELTKMSDKELVDNLCVCVGSKKKGWKWIPSRNSVPYLLRHYALCTYRGSAWNQLKKTNLFLTFPRRPRFGNEKITWSGTGNKNEPSRVNFWGRGRIIEGERLAWRTLCTIFSGDYVVYVWHLLCLVFRTRTPSTETLSITNTACWKAWSAHSPRYTEEVECLTFIYTKTTTSHSD